MSISPVSTSSTTNSSTSSGTSSSGTSTSNSAQAVFTDLGAGSGLDLQSIVTSLINAEQQPIQANLDYKSSQIQTNISAYGTLQSTLASFQTAFDKLKNNSFFNSQTASSSDTSLFTATSDNTAAIANYHIDVTAMAKASKIVSQGNFADANAVVGSGTLTIGFVGGKSFSVAVAANDSLTTIRDNINSSSGNTGVTASLITVDAGLGNGSTVTQLMLTSNNTGKANQLTVSANDNDGNNTDNNGLSQLNFDGANPLAVTNHMKQVNAAQDAQIAVDGMTAYSSSNTISNIIPGITLNLLKDSGGGAPLSAALMVTTDKSAINGEVQALVASYNATIGIINKLTSYDPSTQIAGALNGDSTVASIKQQMRETIFSTVSGAKNGLNSMALLGITANNDGTISLDNSKLNNAISSNYQDLTNLFSGSTGIATRMNSLLTSSLGSSGSIKLRQNSFQKQLNDISTQEDQLNKRMSVEKASLQAQYAALDTLISQMNSTSSYLTQMFNSTNGTTKK